MFFQGTLQDGIAAAVQEAKLVVCFVTDDETESKQWQEEFLTDGAIEDSLRTEAVLLRLQAGSEEAKYLAAIFPLPKTPTLVLIRNGELKEYIAAGVTKEEFIGRVRKALGLANLTPTPHPEPVQQSVQPAVGHRSTAVAEAAAPEPSSGNTSSTQDTPASSSYEDQQQDQRHRRATAEERRRQEKGKGKAQPEKSPASDSGGGPIAPDNSAGKPQAEAQKAAEIYKKRKQEALDERRRILEQIEHDKAARRARDEARKAERRAAAATATSALQDDELNGAGIAKTASSPSSSSAADRSPAVAAGTRRTETCALQFRDFDGSTMRTRLPSSSTLRKEVRQWVDANRPAGGPYVFKVVLTPLPNRTVDETEEDGTLADLGLAPSSTLILVPVSRFSTAYAAAPDGGVLSRVLGFILGIFNAIVLMFRTLLGGQGRADTERAGNESEAEHERSSQQRQAASGRDGHALGNIRRRQDNNTNFSGFRNPNDDRRDQQLYNGNSLNFESRPDED